MTERVHIQRQRKVAVLSIHTQNMKRWRVQQNRQKRSTQRWWWQETGRRESIQITEEDKDLEGRWFPQL